MVTARLHNRIRLDFTGHHREMSMGTVDIYPGMLLKTHTDGTARPHSTAGGAGGVLIADMDMKAGGRTVDDVYDADGTDLNSTIPVLIPQEGDILAVRVADGETLVTGVTLLVSAGDGNFVATTNDDEYALFVAAESIETDGVTLCKARRIATEYIKAAP